MAALVSHGEILLDICEDAVAPEIFFLATNSLVLQPLTAVKIKLNNTQESISVKHFRSKGLVPLSEHQKTISIFLTVLAMFS